MSANKGSKKILKKNTETSGKLIIAVNASVGYVYIPCTCLSGDCSIIPYLLDWGLGYEGQ